MFHYYPASETCPETTHNAFVATVPEGIATVPELAGALNRALRFPGWSGKNFDALWDNLRTLDTVKEHDVVVVHRAFPNLDGDDAGVYAGLLRDVVLFWRRHAKQHAFQAWFPESDREKIKALLDTMPPYEEEDQ